MEPLPLARLAQEAHARGLVVGAAVHAFNRWQWAEADFTVDGATVHAPLDALSLRYGDGADTAKPPATTPNRYSVLDRRSVSFPPMQNVNRMVGYNTAVGTLAEIAIDAASGKVAVLTHHTILECGNMLVPELVSSQLQGGVATGIGLALHEICRSTRMVRATAPGISTATVCRAATTSRYGRRPRRSCRRCRRTSRRREWPRWW
jgi:CO/xanthine dehydrogenase Mo-binding subunit